jgi:hypothetical protein
MHGDDAQETLDLRAELAHAAQLTDLAERTLAVVAVIEAVAAPLGIHPVVVGGMAVYFWTASDEFLTYDIDVVMEAPDELAAKLAELGFARASDGRHWILEGTEVLLRRPAHTWTPTRWWPRSNYGLAERQRSSPASMCSSAALTSSRPPATKPPRSRRSGQRMIVDQQIGRVALLQQLERLGRHRHMS